MMLIQSLLFIILLPLLILAQDGSISGPTSSADAAGYVCDPSKCQLPNCNCASPNPPGGLDPVSAHINVTDEPCRNGGYLCSYSVADTPLVP